MHTVLPQQSENLTFVKPIVIDFLKETCNDVDLSRFDIIRFSEVNLLKIKRVAVMETRECLEYGKMEEIMEQKSKIAEIIKTMDVLKGVYEGGMKVWECAIDLIDYLKNNRNLWVGKSVIDIGCGHGLPGIFCLLNGAENVTFQDLNAEVIRFVTIPNILANISAVANVNRNVQCLAGDWADPLFLKLLAHYDVILTSDTLYSCDSMPYLANVIKSHLKPSGIALVAAKRFYFGVGGSTAEFRSYFDQSNAKVVKIFEDGSSNIREILEIKNQS